MTDILTSEERSSLMSRIRGRDTKPEMAVRRMLHGMGFRFRLHRRDLPGRPDIVLPRWKAAVQVNGCFFHGHDCAFFRLPSSNREFWRAKINRNRERDLASTRALVSQDWRVMTIWECALRGSGRLEAATLLDAMADFIRGEVRTCVLAGGSVGEPSALPTCPREVVASRIPASEVGSPAVSGGPRWQK